MTLVVGSTLAGKWTIDAEIGAGGMATVYAATHRNGHRAAIKLLNPMFSRDTTTRARFLREGYAANKVAHPGVVIVEDDGVTDDGSAFLVLELLEGETMETRRLRLGGALPVDEVLDLADQALDALAAAHEKGIVHRDVKPDNLFVTVDGAVKILDFGLARIKGDQIELAPMEATQAGVTIGTPEFMPPEQASGRRDEVDARSDVWGLGATMFATLTGEYVHDASSLREQLVASATRRARPVKSVAPHVSDKVAQVIDKALELEPSDRWPGARDMQRALRSARGGRRGDHQPVFESDSVTTRVVPGTRPSRPSRLERPEPDTAEEAEVPTALIRASLADTEEHPALADIADQPTRPRPQDMPLPPLPAPMSFAPPPASIPTPPLPRRRSGTKRFLVAVLAIFVLGAAAGGYLWRTGKLRDLPIPMLR